MNRAEISDHLRSTGQKLSIPIILAFLASSPTDVLHTVSHDIGIASGKTIEEQEQIPRIVIDCSSDPNKQPSFIIASDFGHPWLEVSRGRYPQFIVVVDEVINGRERILYSRATQLMAYESIIIGDSPPGSGDNIRFPPIENGRRVILDLPYCIRDLRDDLALAQSEAYRIAQMGRILNGYQYVNSYVAMECGDHELIARQKRLSIASRQEGLDTVRYMNVLGRSDLLFPYSFGCLPPLPPTATIVYPSTVTATALPTATTTETPFSVGTATVSPTDLATETGTITPTASATPSPLIKIFFPIANS